MDTDTYKTTRIWSRTLQVLRFIHAITGESIVSILDRLTKQELERLQREDPQGAQSLQVQALPDEKAKDAAARNCEPLP